MEITSSYLQNPYSVSKTSLAQEKPQTSQGDDSQVEKAEKEQGEKKKFKADGSKELTSREKQQVEKLKARDQEVRIHENAHKAVGGQYIRGAIHYDYQKGPDGKNYAVGGHVNIDTAPIPNDPRGTIQKMQVVRRAALAPQEPSSADHSVAQKASQLEAQARNELLQEQVEDSKSSNLENKNEEAKQKYSAMEKQQNTSQTVSVVA